MVVSMFIYTAKFSRKKAIIAVLVLAVILCAIIFIAARDSGSSGASGEASLSATVKNNAQRIAYLNSLGWEVSQEPIEEQSIIIPKEFSDVYKDYNKLQLSQGFDLSEYCGLEATRYTYQITNYPGTKDMIVVDIIVYQNRVIAGDVQSTALDGFMKDLRFPK